MGKAWDGDWRARVRDRVRALGFRSLLEWADTHPLISYVDLARTIDPDDVAGAQVEKLLVEDAYKQDAATIHRFLRASLARHLHERMPSSGWDAKGTPAWSSAAGASAAWWSEIPRDRTADRERGDRVWAELAGRAPRGWRPNGPDDPVLIAALESVGLGEVEKK